MGSLVRVAVVRRTGERREWTWVSHAEEERQRGQGVPGSESQGTGQGHTQDAKVKGKEGEGSQGARLQGEGARWGRRCIIVVAKITSLISLPVAAEEKVAGSGTSVALPIVHLLTTTSQELLSSPLFRLFSRTYNHH